MRSSLRQHQQKPGTEREARITCAQHLAPLEAIRRMSRNQEQKDARQELREPYQAEIQRAFREVVNLPSHRDRLHLHRSHNQKSRNLEQHKVGMSKREASCSGVGGGWDESSDGP